MRYTLLYIAVLFLSLTQVATAQVSVEATMDRVEMYIGEQARISLRVTAPAKQRIILPVLQAGKELTQGVEVVEESKTDTTLLNEGKHIELSKSFTITAFDSSLYYLPPLDVQVGDKKYSSKSLALKVHTVEVDTLHYDQFFPPADIMNVPFMLEDWKIVFYALGLLLLTIAALVFLFFRSKSQKPLLRRVKTVKYVPPHQWAMTEIEKIKVEAVNNEVEAKAYYTRITDTLRTYMYKRYGFNACEMTSTEIILRLESEKDAQMVAELKQLLETADLVKFAKYASSAGEKGNNLLRAIDFVNATKEEQPSVPINPPVLTEEEKQSRNISLLLRVLFCLLGILGLVLLAVIGNELMNLLL